MMIKIKNSYLLIILTALFALSSCNNDDDASPESNNSVSVEGKMNSEVNGAFFRIDKVTSPDFFRSYTFSPTPEHFVYGTDRNFWLPAGPDGISTDIVTLNLYFSTPSEAEGLVSGTYNKNNFGPFSQIFLTYYRYPEMNNLRSYEKGYSNFYSLSDSVFFNDFELTVEETESTIKITLNCEVSDVDDFDSEPTLYPLRLTYEGEIRRP